MTLTQDSGPDFITDCSKPGVVALTFDDGPEPYTNKHQIGVHTYTHPHLNDLTSEIVKVNDAILNLVITKIVEAFEEKGYTFETVAECLVNDVESYKNKDEDGKTTKNENNNTNFGSSAPKHYGIFCSISLSEF
ncbi:hypothetical protein C2G38_2196518 [Gigaspora rosea]|uniref:NodB homology domain-containing protein n=1 Tax=Gigaspora rosea TaxID=44941 RepID=A0A397UVV0_9GLOM|nr:hypothetical protein C2G38_2196518 [Gigaspora rosea]